MTSDKQQHNLAMMDFFQLSMPQKQQAMIQALFLMPAVQ